MRKILFWTGCALLIAVTTFFAFPFSKPFMHKDYGYVIKDENGKILRIFLNKQEQWCLPPEDTIAIPVKLKTAVINFEDEYYNWHVGVNPVSIFRAAYQNFSQNRIVSGASTIPMQVARIREGNKRTAWNKIKEIILALKISLHYSKNSILKLYLNHAPYGKNIIGYRTASFRFFQKQPKELSWGEAALLAVLPNAPALARDSENEIVLKRKRDKLLTKLYINKEINKETYRLSILEPVKIKDHAYQIVAAHLTQRIVSEEPKEKIINTTINYSLQKYLENLIKYQLTTLKSFGIKNGAALVIETQTGKVKAYIGSQDFKDDEAQGQIDGVMAKRSSGSILKPFLYAIAMDDGLILPQTVLMDIPSYFDAYSPSNADEKFSGIVPAKEALTHSLNIPAVRLLNTYGVNRFYSFLKNAGVNTLFRQPEDYGLPLVIGGAEVTLWDMAMLYRGLGNYGIFRHQYFLKNDSLKIEYTKGQLLSNGACFLTLDILKELNRPGNEYFWKQYENQKPIAWKTGTSFGNRDAWAIGVNPQWTIAVWIGNFDGELNLSLTGASTAGAMLFSIFNYLPNKSGLQWFEKVEMDFKTVKICKETGYLASEYCTQKIDIDAPINMLPLRLCPYHKNIFVDKDENYEVCSYCWQPGYHEKQILNYPAEVNYQLKQRGQFIESIPAHNPSCTHKSEINPLQIIYPTDSSRILIPKDFNNQKQMLIVKIAHNNPSKKIFWYCDDNYIGATTEAITKAFDLNHGWHKIKVIDEDGFDDLVHVNIKSKK